MSEDQSGIRWEARSYETIQVEVETAGSGQRTLATAVSLYSDVVDSVHRAHLGYQKAVLRLLRSVSPQSVEPLLERVGIANKTMSAAEEDCRRFRDRLSTFERLNRELRRNLPAGVPQAEHRFGFVDAGAQWLLCPQFDIADQEHRNAEERARDLMRRYEYDTSRAGLAEATAAGEAIRPVAVSHAVTAPSFLAESPTQPMSAPHRGPENDDRPATTGSGGMGVLPRSAGNGDHDHRYRSRVAVEQPLTWSDFGPTGAPPETDDVPNTADEPTDRHRIRPWMLAAKEQRATYLQVAPPVIGN